MNRKIITSLVFACAAWGSSLNAQCTPDPNLNSPGYSPDTMQHAQVGVAYSQGISVRTPHDTSVIYNGNPISARVDSIKATDVKGLPSGITYTCQHPRCVFLWDTTRCVAVHGTTSQGGVFPIKIMVTYYALLGGTFKVAYKDSIQKFTLIVDGGTNATIDHSKPGMVFYPNPASEKAYFTLGNEAFSGIRFYSMNGKQISIPFQVENGLVVLDLKNIPDGVYQIQAGRNTGKIVINR